MDIRSAFSQGKLKKFHIALLIICLLVVIVEGYDLVIFGSIVSNLIKEWQLTTVVAGLIGSAALVGMMVGSFVLGILADKIGRKKVVIISLSFFSIFTGLAGFLQSPELFAVCRFLAGIGIGGAMPNAIALLSDYMPQRYRNTMIAIATTGMQVGGILAPVISLLAVPTFGWRFCLYVGFVPLIVVPFIIAILPDSLDHLILKGKFDAIKKVLTKTSPEIDILKVQIAANTTGHEKSPVIELFRNKRALNTFMFWLQLFMSLLMIYGLNTWLPMLMKTAGYGLGSDLTFLIVLNSVGLIGSVILGRIADKLNPRKVIIPLYIVGAISMLLLSINGGIAYAYIIVSICGLCVFGCQNLSLSFIAQYYPGRIRSSGLGIANTVGRVGGILGPTLGGVLLAAQLPMFLNCLSFAVPGVICSVAYMIARPKDERDELSEPAMGSGDTMYIH